MLLALRETAPENASAWKRFVCWVIRARLASRYSHGGIVINGTLYHITASHGAHSLPLEQWSPERWSLFDVGGDDEAALALFSRVMEGPPPGFKRWVWRAVKGYDWFSLLAFVGVSFRVSWLRYCFELCWLMRTADEPTGRVTPEALLVLAGRSVREDELLKDEPDSSPTMAGSTADVS